MEAKGSFEEAEERKDLETCSINIKSGFVFFFPHVGYVSFYVLCVSEIKPHMAHGCRKTINGSV